MVSNVQYSINIDKYFVISNPEILVLNDIYVINYNFYLY